MLCDMTSQPDVIERIERIERFLGLAAGSDTLAGLKAFGEFVRTTDQRVRELVKSARKDGHSWTDIGEALGISRQGAWERFASRREDVEPPPILYSLSLAGQPTEDQIRR